MTRPAAVRLTVGAVLAAAACSGSPSDPSAVASVGGGVLTAEVTVDYSGGSGGRTLWAHVVLTNVGRFGIKKWYSGDAWRFRAYTTPERTGIPAWRWEDSSLGYPLYLSLLDLGPGESRAFEAVVGPVSDIVRDSTVRKYYLTLAIQFHEPDELTPEIYAGEVELP
jgi:hypothetical protein